MVGHRRLAQRERPGDLTRREVPLAEQIEDAPPRGIVERAKEMVHGTIRYFDKYRITSSAFCVARLPTPPPPCKLAGNETPALFAVALAGCLISSRRSAPNRRPSLRRGTRRSGADKKSDDKPDKDKEKDKDKEPPAPVVTDHTITLPGGRVLRYKATAGYLTLRDTAEPKDAKAEGRTTRTGRTNSTRSRASPRRGSSSWRTRWTPRPIRARGR